MTMFNDDFDRIFRQMSSSFGNLDDVFKMLKNSSGQSGPIYFGYTAVSYTHLTLPTKA